jgi:hypothetical protein
VGANASYRRFLNQTGNPRDITAVGRELLGFVWAIGIKAETASKLQMAA